MIEWIIFCVAVLVISIIIELVHKEGNKNISEMIENNKWERHADEFYKHESNWKE